MKILLSRNLNRSLLSPAFLLTGLVFLSSSPSQAVSTSSSSSSGAITVERGSGAMSEDKKERLLKDTVNGTVMRSGVVYPIHAPIPAIDLARAFLREGRPAASTNEIRELMNGLTSGDPKALENFRRHMDTYLMDPSKGPQLIGALNKAIDNPNAYKADPTFAQGVLRESFENFLSLDGEDRPNTDFSRVNLDGFTVSGADLRQTGLKGNKLDYFTDWTGTNASGLDLKEVNWQGKTIAGSIFRESILEEANFAGMNIGGANFDKAFLFKAKFNGATNLGNASFKDAKAQQANFGGIAGLNGDFNGADLSNADFRGSSGLGTDFRNANLSEILGGLPNFINALYGNNILGCATR